MIKLIVAGLYLAAGATAQDAAEILSKARAAFVENRGHARFWTWITVTERTIIDKNDAVLETLPSVTVESPIRSDGKRCNAVLAWGDGVEPYKANASADERCAVEQEIASTLRLEAFLASRQVKIQSKSDNAIKLTIREDKQAMESTDPVQRCAASLRGTVDVDPATFFPAQIEITAPSDACELKQGTAVNHYDDDTIVRHVNAGVAKGAILRYEYQRQRDKGDSASRDYWIVAHSHTVTPLRSHSGGTLISGRLFQLASHGSDRRLVVDGKTTAKELAAESFIKFETEKEKEP